MCSICNIYDIPFFHIRIFNLFVNFASVSFTVKNLSGQRNIEIVLKLLNRSDRDIPVLSQVFCPLKVQIINYFMMINEHSRQFYSLHVRELVFVNPPEKIVPSPIDEI